QQQQQQQMLQTLSALLQGSQPPPAAAPPPPPQPVQQLQQPQNTLLQQLQQHLLLQQLSAAAAAQPAAGSSASSLTTLLLLLQQQQQLTSALMSGGGGNGAVGGANQLMQMTSAVLQQNQQQEQTLMQQRLLMEILNSGQNERSSTLPGLGSTGGSRETAIGGLTSLSRPQPLESSQQSSSRSLLQQLQQGAAAAAAVTTTTNPVQPLTHPPPMIRGNSGLDQARAAQAAAAAARAAAVPQANMNDPSSVETRIQRLIKQNEEILEPAPVLLKRRPYHRALGPQASIDNDSNHSGSSRTSPGPRFPPPTSRPLPPPTTRSQSLFELGLKPSSSSSIPLPSSSLLPNGSLTSGQPMNRGGGGITETFHHMFMSGVEPSCSRRNENAPECPHCKVGFPNEPTREAHQAVCSKKESCPAASDPLHPDNRHPLKRRMMAAVEKQEEAAAKIARMSADIKPSTSFSSSSVGNNGEDIIIVGERAAPAAPSGSTADPLRSPYRQPALDAHALSRRATVATFPDSAASTADGTAPTSSSSLSTKEQQIELIRMLMARGLPIDESILAIVGAGSPAAIPAPPPAAPAPPAAAPPPLVKSGSEDSDDIQVRGREGNPLELTPPLHGLSTLCQVIETSPVSSKPPSTASAARAILRAACTSPSPTRAAPAAVPSPTRAAPAAVNSNRAASAVTPSAYTNPITMRDQLARTSFSEGVGRGSESSQPEGSGWTRGEKADPERAFKISGELRGGNESPYYMTYPLCSPHLVCVSESGLHSRRAHPDIKLEPTPYAAAAPVGFSRDSVYATTMCGDRPMCAPKIMGTEESVYDNVYNLPSENQEAESKLNYLFMGAVSIKPRIGERPFKYEMAKDYQLKSTHSSFWFVSLRQRQLITERAAASAMIGSQISLDDAASEFHAAREAAVKQEIKEEEMKSEIKEEEMETCPPSSSSAVDLRMGETSRGMNSLGGREAKDLSLQEDLTAIVEERRRAMERAKEEEEHEAAIHAAKEHTMTSLGLKTGGEKRRARDNTSVDRMSIGDISALLDMGPEEVPPMAKMQAQRDPVIGGYKTDEVYVYVRGRGRGRYVCERCGIRCKKPSMLKKHIKSHTDVRPYQCTECNFSFKTKGNLTKHLASKAHRRKTTPTEGMGSDSVASSRSTHRRSEIDVVGSDSEVDDEDEDDRMDEGVIDDDVTKEMDINIDNGGSEDEFDVLDYGEEDETVGRGHLPSADRHPYHKFGQEQILIERRAHTPPSVWVRVPETAGDRDAHQWPDTDYSSRGYCRRCTSAPPVVQTMKGEREEEDEGGADPAERRRRDRRKRRRREGGDTRGNGSAASSKGEEKRGEGGDRGGAAGGGATVPGTLALYAQQYSSSDVQLSMTNSNLSAQQAGRNHQMAMSSSYSPCLLDVPKLASALPPSASSLLTQGSDQLNAAALLPSTAAAAAGLVPAQGPSSGSSGPSSSTPLGSYPLESEEMKCGECDRVFRKASDYTMHVHTHNLERGKMRLLYTCSECKLSHKSKQQLIRHIEVIHPLLAARGGAAAAAEEIAARQRSSSSCSSAVGLTAVAAGQELPIEQTILNVTTNMTNNPRSFMCVDCNIGFRKHGILAKHLRSKTHVMKLETQKLLPEDSLTLITKRDNGTCLNEVDTTSCDTARRSILRIVDRIREENAAAAASVQVQALPSQTNGPHSVDDHRRLVLPIAASRVDSAPSAAPTAEAAAAATAAALFSQQSQRGGIPAAELLELLSAAHRSLIAASTSSDSAAAATPSMTTIASAAVWMPPKAEDVQQTAAAAAAAAAFTAVSYAQPTIQRRASFDANGFVDRLGNGHSSTAVTPPALTRCGVCEMNFENPMDHQIHVMTDHVVMRDGHDFACPRPNCEKVYPNKESLRMHILAHFRHYDREEETVAASLARSFHPTAAAAARNEGKEEGEASASDEDTVEMEGGGEESSCPSRASSMEGGLRIAEEEEEGTAEEVRPEREERGGGLPCTMCDAPPFETAAALQNHWMTLHVALRPHVCTTCDASFTRKEQLDFHIATTHPH
ncbi:hypothetical protein PMAYCL1PPCAC_02320, partial [Pristionchus mayeri]